MDWVGSFTAQDISTVLLPKEWSLRMCHSYDQYQIHLWLFNIIEFSFAGHIEDFSSSSWLTNRKSLNSVLSSQKSCPFENNTEGSLR